MDRNGKKPKAAHEEPPHPERSDTKSHHRGEVEGLNAKDRAETEQVEADERLALKNAGHKGPQHL